MARSNRGGALATLRVRAKETRCKLIASGRALFAEAGFVATGINAIVAHAGLTRGAFYHHFPHRAAFFEAVFRDTAEELNDAARAAAAELSDQRWVRVTGSYRAYLLIIASNKSYQRVLLIDGPAVLGWSRWRQLHSEYVAQRTAQALQLLMSDGVIQERPVLPLSNLIQAALNDAALSIADSSEISVSTEESIDAFLFLLESIRSSAAVRPSR